MSICIAGITYAAPEPESCAGHAWTRPDGPAIDTGNGAMLHRDMCAYCGTRRLRRESYLGIASAGPTGDGRDYVLYGPSDATLERERIDEMNRLDALMDDEMADDADRRAYRALIA